MNRSIGGEGAQRTVAEQEAGLEYAQAFDENPDPTHIKFRDFAKYARRQDLTGFLARYEIFKRVLTVKGSVIECGVFRGGGLMAWANFSAILEPNNLGRRVYGFDTFEGFESVGSEDSSRHRETKPGELRSDSFDEIQRLIATFDKNRFLGHVDKVHLVKGDATDTIPVFVDDHPHLLVSLLFLDFDLYEPTKVAIEQLLPRMPKGAIIAFDELDNPAWPGETLAMIDSVGSNRLRIERCEFDPYVGFAVLD